MLRVIETPVCVICAPKRKCYSRIKVNSISRLTSNVILYFLGDSIGSLCTTLSPSYLEWDALAVSLESVLSRIHQMNMLQV